MALAIHHSPAPPRRPAGIAAVQQWYCGMLRALVVVVFMLSAATLSAATPSEDQVKAAFLLNFPKYVDWPAGTFADDTSPIVLTIVADKGVEREVRRMAAGKLFNGRPLEIRAATTTDEIASDCRILFVGVAEERMVAQIIAGLGERSVLTVGEAEDFFDDGGMIRLSRREQKIRLAVNLPSAEARGLRISSKLLSVADVVKRREGASK